MQQLSALQINTESLTYVNMIYIIMKNINNSK